MPVHVLDCVCRPTSGTVAVRIVLEVSLEDWFQHKFCSGLHHAIPDSGNAERALASPMLRDHLPPHRIGPVRLRDQFLAQARQPCFQALFLDLFQGHPVHTGCTFFGAGEPVGVAQNVLATDLVVERIEAESRLRLRLAVELPLKVPDLIWCYWAHRQSPSPSPSSKAHQKSGPFAPPALPGLNAPTTLSDSRHDRRLKATLRPLPSPVTGLPRLPEPPFQRAVPTTPADRAGARVDCFPAHAAFPKWQEGRHPHCHFRGLLRLHSRYGPPDCSAA